MCDTTFAWDFAWDFVQDYPQGLRSFPRSKTKCPPDISSSNMTFQQMRLGTNVIPHFHVILPGQFIFCLLS